MGTELGLPLPVIIFLYFLLVVLIGLFLFFPGIRAAIRRGFAGFFGLFRRRQKSQVVMHVEQAARNARVHNRTFWSSLWMHRWFLLATTVVLLLPVVFVVIAFHGEDPRAKRIKLEEDNSVQMQINGIRLTPPQSLPNEWFATPEVKLLRGDMSKANRDWAMLDPDFMQRLLLVYRTMLVEHNYQMVLIEGLRSEERQEMLDRKRNRSIIDDRNAQALHKTGFAADSVFLRDGRLLILESDPWAKKGYQLFGQVAERYGLKWGGNWKKPDPGHVEYHPQAKKEERRR